MALIFQEVLSGDASEIYSVTSLFFFFGYIFIYKSKVDFAEDVFLPAFRLKYA